MTNNNHDHPNLLTTLTKQLNSINNKPWQQFIKKTTKTINNTNTSNNNTNNNNKYGIPQQQIFTYLQKKQQNTLKQLLLILPSSYNKYKQYPQSQYKQLFILLYILVVKGIQANKQLDTIIEQLLVELLKYRILVIITSYNNNNNDSNNNDNDSNNNCQQQITEVYYYFKDLLEIMTPRLIKNNTIQTILNKCTSYNAIITKNNIIANTTTNTTNTTNIINSSNNNNNKYQQYHNGNQSNKKLQTNKIDHILLIFHGLLITKVSYHLTYQCNKQFKMFIKKIYPEKYWRVLINMIYDNNNSSNNNNSNNNNSSNNSNNRNIQSVLWNNDNKQATNLLNFDRLFLIRQSQQSPYLQSYQLQLHNNNNNTNTNKNNNNKTTIKITKNNTNKIPSSPYIMKAYQQQPESISHLIYNLPNMSIIQIYRFMAQLQIFGGSPKIQILNDYLIDSNYDDGNNNTIKGSKLNNAVNIQQNIDKLLDFFSKFIMNQPLTVVNNTNSHSHNHNNKKSNKYSYNNHNKWKTILQQTMSKCQQDHLNYQQMKIIANQMMMKIIHYQNIKKLSS